jgi:glutamate racemase
MVDAGIDVLVLACTHYPALTGLIAEVLGPDVRIIDPAPAVARQTARVAAESLAANGAGTTQLFTTGDLARLQRAVDRAGIDGPVSLLPLV